jgi:hypothetical protein
MGCLKKDPAAILLIGIGYKMNDEPGPKFFVLGWGGWR